MSLSRVGLIGGIDLHWAGLDNWTRLFSDESVGASWVRSIVYFVLTVGLEMTLGIGMALLVHSMVWGKNLVLVYLAQLRIASVYAKPLLVVASALKPSRSSTIADPMSHGFGIMNGSPSWSARKLMGAGYRPRGSALTRR